MSKPIVSVVKFDDPYQSLRRSLDLSEGLKGFSKEDKVLIKPNLVSWDFDLPFPPYGVVTTSAVIAALVRILAEEGFTRLTIGEAPLMVPKTVGQAMFKILGYHKLKEKYGVELVDFNEEKFVKVDCDGFELSLAEKALEADKIIDVPVLKTHNQTKVSLGIKNLKGCLNRKSKMFCHGAQTGLDHTFPHIIEKLPVALTIIDGVFGMAKGPGPTGKAERLNLLAASQDPLSADVVGAALLGYNAADIKHLGYFAKRSGGSVNLEDIDVRGEDVAANSKFLDYDWEWTADDTGPLGYVKRGITGLAVRKYDSTMCTGCSMLFNPLLIMLMSAFKGEPFPNVEVVSGKVQKAAPGFDKTVLFGRCACSLNKDNPNIKKAIAIKGCPPDLMEFEKAMREEGIMCDYKEYVKYRHYIYNRYKAEDGFDMGLFDVQ
ncbi:DUF362 domain-containing protein [Desulfoscipio sp. XC116]|uniref:DUF362 domain-containing protein n=1 Tax=Desulfoscipio sp. XC116 TaxID=3144975 RepID=UPI00325AF82A